MRLRSFVTVVLLGALALPIGSVRGEEATDVENRLRETLEAAPAPALNTILALTNMNGEPAKAQLHAFYRNGGEAGVIELEVPANGVAFALASDFPRPDPARQRFIGTVKVRATGHVVGTAILAGGPLTDLPALNEVRRVANTSVSPRVVEQVSSIVFPVVASY